jgi:hypothetical protein
MSDFIPTREQLDEHKTRRMADYRVRTMYCHITAEQCKQAIIEQLGDAELYQQRLRELEAEG